MIEHPDITHIRRTGYSKYNERTGLYGVDALGNEVYKGDEILVLDDTYFLTDELLGQTEEVLKLFGATYHIAE